MERKIILKDPEAQVEMTLPITPESYEVSTAVNVELVNIHELGDVVFGGNGKLASFQIKALLPATRYDFAASDNPQRYLDQIQKWIKNKTKLRYVVKGTKVNLPVLIEGISYGEKDGTNDVYADIAIREYRPLKAPQVQQNASSNKLRETPPEKDVGETAYTAQYGDTLCSICRKFYGNDSPDTYNRLAAYNGKPNPNILMTGEVLRIPQPLP